MMDLDDIRKKLPILEQKKDEKVKNTGVLTFFIKIFSKMVTGFIYKHHITKK